MLENPRKEPVEDPNRSHPGYDPDPASNPEVEPEPKEAPRNNPEVEP
jgi:hypothetical protein